MKHKTDIEDMDFELGDATRVLDALIRHSGDCVKVIDLDGRVVRWSPACEEVYGWSATEVLGSRLPCIPEDLRLRAVSDFRAVAGAGRVVERDIECQRNDGSRLNMRVMLIPLSDVDGDAVGLLAVAREVFGDRRLDRQREDFLSFVGRGLTEPLATIENAAGLLLRPEIGKDAERRARLSATIAKKAHSAAAIVDDLLLMSSLESQGLVLDREIANVVALVSDAVASFGDESRRIVVDFDSTLGSALVDVGRLHRVVRVLIAKALKQTPADRDIFVSVLQKGSEVAIEVRDQGQGIDPVEVERIFDHYYAGPEARGSDDIGIGLYLVRGVVEAHGGRVLVTSSAGVTFTVMLPVAGGGA